MSPGDDSEYCVLILLTSASNISFSLAILNYATQDSDLASQILNCSLQALTILT